MKKNVRKKISVLSFLRQEEREDYMEVLMEDSPQKEDPWKEGLKKVAWAGANVGYDLNVVFELGEKKEFREEFFARYILSAKQAAHELKVVRDECRSFLVPEDRIEEAFKKGFQAGRERSWKTVSYFRFEDFEPTDKSFYEYVMDAFAAS